MGQDDESFPEGLDVRTTEAGGEVSMSLEETNRVREKLGLKPLRTGESDRAKSKREAEEAAHAARADEAKAKQTAEISARSVRKKHLFQYKFYGRTKALKFFLEFHKNQNVITFGLVFYSCEEF